MEWTYDIMHLERFVARISSDGLCRIAEPQFMPYNLWLEEGGDISDRINNLTNFYYWCASRRFERNGLTMWMSGKCFSGGWGC